MMWQIINKKVAHVENSYQDIWLQSNLGKITHPQKVADLFNSYFIEK
jgi:protoheme ferro-lyase